MKLTGPASRLFEAERPRCRSGNFSFSFAELDRGKIARENVTTPDSAPRRRWLKPLLWGLAIVGVVALLFWSGVALETYVLSQRMPLLASVEKLQVGMTQQEVEDLFGVKPEDRKAPERGRIVVPMPHEGVKRYTEMKDDDPDGNTYIRYSAWYHGFLVTSQHVVSVTYDGNGKLKQWQAPAP
jgi:hypothetical protein